MREAPGTNGGWRCVIREREKQLRYWHKAGGGYTVRRRRDLGRQRADVLARLIELNREGGHVA